ncbi:Coatomer subunit delta [Dinochytrium kinnereticum]|nr:Coatomer subunit delta [Dinochytrium kinnereticum]
MPRSRIEGLLASFPKLIGSSDQHTFVETDSVRYVYQPLDELYMVLITNKQSNILQDIDTLHLFARVVSEYCRSSDERDISRQSFELLNVFDEIIAMGYRESINLAQIRTITEMESHEERIQAEIEKNREKEAKDELNRKAKMMDVQRREMAKKGISGGVPSISGGFGSGGGGSAQYGGFKQSQQSYSEPSSSQPSYESYSSQTASASRAAPAGKGMQLGRKQKNDALFEAIKTEEGIEATTDRSAGQASNPGSQSSHTEGIHVNVEEKINLRVNRDGALENMEVKGTLTLLVRDSKKPGIKLKLKPVHNDAISFNTHPKVDKDMFANSVIGLKDPAVNCWPSPSGSGSCDVNIEYDLQSDRIDLREVSIIIPYPGNAAPTIGDVEGHYRVDRQRKFIEWQLPLIDQSNKSGVLEFSVDSEDVAGFFPIQVQFTSNKTMSDIEVVDAMGGDGARLQFSKESRLVTDSYTVV